MAVTIHERVGGMLELLTAGLRPFVEWELRAAPAGDWFAETNHLLAESSLRMNGTPEEPQWDAAAILVTVLAASQLRRELDRVPLWRGDHVSIKQLAEDFACYVYLPRLRDTRVLVDAVRNGVGMLDWQQDSFAYAESYDDERGRYRGLRTAQHVLVEGDSPVGLLVRPDAAQRQLEADADAEKVVDPQPDGGTDDGSSTGGTGTHETTKGGTQGVTKPTGPRRFHGTATLDAARVGRDAAQIANEVIAHLVGIVGAKVRVTLEIEAEIPSGASEHVVRTVTENCRTLRFDSQGFEAE